MTVEFYVLNLDELQLGFSMNHGEDEMGNQIHMTTLGFLIFSINFIVIKDENY